jgi:hypothetical protein
MFSDEYNTCRPTLILKEYGRNIQKLIDYLKTIEDRDKRNEDAAIMIELMKQINPAIKDNQETSQKMWDDLFIMSNFELDVDSPFPIPNKEILLKKPEPVGYNFSEIRFKHYGRNIELLIQKAISIEDPEEKEAAVIYIGRLMKSFHSIWNKENIDDNTIIKNIRILSNRQLDIDLEKVQSGNLFNSFIKERKGGKSNGKGRRGGGSSNRRRRN